MHPARLAAVAVPVCLALPFSEARAQHEHHDMTAASADAMIAPLGVSMDRWGSGTTWIPDAVPLPAWRGMAGSWLLMGHGFAFLQYNTQGGPRGDDQVAATNWAMGMASRNLAGGRFQARAMLSLDPATVGGRGYPLLLQSGESYQGQPIVDRQHPHDFLMELGVMYERALTRSLGVLLYAAPSGEPALGPVAFMHRPSGADDPLAPLSHHRQDATHITFGVLTAGVFGSRWKVEGSWFNGREPDEHRWGFDRLRLDSYSGRFTVNPDSTWSFTAGYGRLTSPEALHPGDNIERYSASVLFSRSYGMDGHFASSLVWGANKSHGHTTHAVVFEADAIVRHHMTVYGRAELVEKSAEELALPSGAGGFDPDSILPVTSVSLGLLHDVGEVAGVAFGLGVRGTVNFVPDALRPIYGSGTPRSALVYLRLRPVHRAPVSHEEMMR